LPPAVPVAVGGVVTVGGGVVVGVVGQVQTV
jgi:hypothetical protein